MATQVAEAVTKENPPASEKQSANSTGALKPYPGSLGRPQLASSRTEVRQNQHPQSGLSDLGGSAGGAANLPIWQEDGLQGTACSECG
jgi:hypothetical protein